MQSNKIMLNILLKDFLNKLIRTGESEKIQK